MRVPNLALIGLIGMTVVVAGVGYVMGGIVLIGLAGGFMLGGLMLLRGRRTGPFTATWPVSSHDVTDDWPPAGIINMSNIRVAGAGGLGLVAMAAAVALGVPAIGAAMTIALAGGALGAVLVIRYRSGRALGSSRR